MAAAFYKLDNLVAIFDKNLVQATGTIMERYDTNPHAEKWKAFGWHVLEIDGHDIQQIADALDEAGQVKGKPVMIVAHTVKSKGVPFAEGKAAFHHGIMTQEQFETARKLFVELQDEQERSRELDIEFGQLQLEQSTWAMQSRIEQVASKKLGMRVPPEGRVRVVPPPPASSNP